MSENNFTPNTQIAAFYPNDKIGLFIEDCTHFKKPKLRIALVPTDGSQPVEFFHDLAVCRLIFRDLEELGYLRDDCLFKTIDGKNGPLQDCDLFAKIGENGHRSLTIINMDDGIYLKIIAKNGDKISRGAPLSSFNARMIGMAVSEYIQQLPLRQILAQATSNRTQESNNEDNDDPDSDDPFPG